MKHEGLNPRKKSYSTFEMSVMMKIRQGLYTSKKCDNLGGFFTNYHDFELCNFYKLILMKKRNSEQQRLADIEFLSLIS